MVKLSSYQKFFHKLIWLTGRRPCLARMQFHRMAGTTGTTRRCHLQFESWTKENCIMCAWDLRDLHRTAARNPHLMGQGKQGHDHDHQQAHKYLLQLSSYDTIGHVQDTTFLYTRLRICKPWCSCVPLLSIRMGHVSLYSIMFIMMFQHSVLWVTANVGHVNILHFDLPKLCSSGPTLLFA